MKAAVYHGPRDVRVECVPNKVPGEDEILIQVKYCGVCGTDLHIYNGDGGSSDVVPPLIPGHEFSGIVSAVGEKATHFQVGDRVSADPNWMCGECYFCRNGKPHFCKRHQGIGTSWDGAFAEYIIVPEKLVYRIGDKLNFIQAAMAEPVSCCLHGIDLCEIKAGDTVLVIGGGPIGMIMVQLARNAGASKVILSEPVREKRELALKLGADLAINPLEEDVQAVLRESCENVDVVIECVGNLKTIEQAVLWAGNTATVMLFGLAAPGEAFPLKPDDVFKKELKIVSSFVNPNTFERALQVLESGRIDVESIISNIVDLDDIEEVFTNPEYRKKGKVMIKVNG